MAVPFNEDAANAKLQKKGLGGAGAANLDEKQIMPMPPEAPPSAPPLNNPKPLGYGAFEPFMDAMMARQLLFGVDSQNMMQKPQFNILQPPPGLPTVGYGGPMQLPTPPQGGRPPPQSR